MSRDKASSSTLTYVDAIDGHRAGSGVEQARDEVEERCLAAARAPDHGRDFARARFEVDATEHGFLSAWVAELDTRESGPGLGPGRRGQG